MICTFDAGIGWPGALRRTKARTAWTTVAAGSLAMAIGTAQSADYVYTGPAASGTPVTSTVEANVTGADKITITTTRGGTITTTSGQGIATRAVDGSTTINLGANVTSQTGPAVQAIAGAGAGSVSINAGQGVSIQSSSETGIWASSGGGVDIGGSVGLTGEVSGLDGIVAWAMGTGGLHVKTWAGGKVTGTLGNAISAVTMNSPINIELTDNVYGAVSAVSAYSYGTGSISILVTGITHGETNAITVNTDRGEHTNSWDVTIENRGITLGSIIGGRYAGGTGTFSIVNKGTISVHANQSVSGFDSLLNYNLLWGAGTFGPVTMGTLNGMSGTLQVRGPAAAGNVAQLASLTITSTGTRAMLNVAAVGAPIAAVADKISVTGAAILTGSELVVSVTNDNPDWWRNLTNPVSFTVLTAGSITGQFATVTLSNAPSLTAQMTYVSGKVAVLTLTKRAGN